METPTVANGAKSRKKNWKKLLVWLISCILLLALVFHFVSSRFFLKADGGNLKFITPTIAQFRHEIAVRGDISSSENQDIKCRVRSTGGVMITWVVDEGTEVKEGDTIAVLDNSTLIDNLDAQQIKVAQSEAEVKAAENNLLTAQIAKEEYENGSYKVNLQKLVSAQIKAKEERDRLAEYLQHSKILYEKGFVTQSQLEADVFSLKQAELTLRAAELDIYVLKEYTHNKQCNNYESDIKTADANLSSKKSVHLQNEAKLKDIQQQIEFCTIKSPADGKVLYVNETNRFGSSEFLVCQGAMVRERQTFLRLPNTTKLQVTADIHEGKISYVKVGQHVQVHTDATGDKSIRGTVIKVDENPQPTNHWMGNVKEYRVTIQLENPEGVLPGMTAETKILVEESQDEKLMIPTHAVFEHGGKYYCIEKKADGKLYPIVVELGHSNDKMVIVTSEGLNEKTQLLAAAFENREMVKLPELATGQTSSPTIRTNNEAPSTDAQGDSSSFSARTGPNGPQSGMDGMRKGPSAGMGDMNGSGRMDGPGSMNGMRPNGPNGPNGLNRPNGPNGPKPGMDGKRNRPPVGMGEMGGMGPNGPDGLNGPNGLKPGMNGMGTDGMGTDGMSNEGTPNGMNRMRPDRQNLGMGETEGTSLDGPPAGMEGQRPDGPPAGMEGMRPPQGGGEGFPPPGAGGGSAPPPPPF